MRLSNPIPSLCTPTLFHRAPTPSSLLTGRGDHEAKTSLQVRSNPQDCIGSAHHLRPVGDTYARYVKAPEAVIDLSFILDIEVCRALVKEMNLWLSVERSRKQHSLLLAARQGTPHVSDQAVVTHRHCHDFLVDLSHLRAQDHSFLVKGRIEEVDVVCDGP